MPLLVDAGRADELAILALLRVRARRQHQPAANDEEVVRRAAWRIALRAMRDEARRRGLELFDEEAAALEDDSPNQEQADVDVLLAGFEAHGGHATYRLEEWRRHAAQWAPLREVLSEILANTPAEYAQVIQDELRQVIGAEHPETVLSRQCGPLTRRAWELAERVVGVRPWAPNNYDGPLALPREVCEAVLADDRLLHAYDCSVCGYELPVSWAQRDADGRFMDYRPCPVCGGRVGYCAWYETKRARERLEREVI